MSGYLFLKAIMIWFIMAVFAVLNGLIRENIFVPYLGEAVALPISGITLSIIIFTITFLSFRLFDKCSSIKYLYIGMLWVAMTLAFEMVYGHFVIGKSWQELFEVFNVFKGDLFVLVLLVTLFSLIIVSRIRKQK